MQPQIERFQTIPHPAVLLGMTKKSGVDVESDAMRKALLAAKGCDLPLPVSLHNKVIGWVRGCNFPDPSVYWSRDKMWCGFATYDAIINAMTGGSKLTIPWTKAATSNPVATNWYDDWQVGGIPLGGAVNNTAKTAIIPTDATTGALYHGGNVSSATKHLVSCAYLASAGTPVFILYDRLLTYDQCGFGTSTVQQSMTNGGTMSRYIDSGSGGAAGGKLICAVGPTLTGANSGNFSELTYADQDGNGSSVMPVSPTPYVIESAATGTATLGARIIAPSLTAAGTVVFSWCMPMAASDKGMRSITTYTMTHSSQTGNFSLTLIHPLCILPVPAAAVGSLIDQVMQLANLERIVDGACISLMHLNPSGTAGGTYIGSIDVAWA